jgi:hypothetical protein
MQSLDNNFKNYYRSKCKLVRFLKWDIPSEIALAPSSPISLYLFFHKKCDHYFCNCKYSNLYIIILNITIVPNANLLDSLNESFFLKLI